MSWDDEIDLTAKLNAANEEIRELKKAVKWVQFKEDQLLLKQLLKHKHDTGVCPICDMELE